MPDSPHRPAWYNQAWFWVSVVLAILCLVAASWIVLAPLLRKPATVEDPAAAAALAAREAENAGLAARIEILRRRLEEPVCPEGGTSGVLPGAAPVPGSGAAVSPSRPPANLATAATAPLDDADLVARLERATALILYATPDGAGLGSGFFIAPDLLVTNGHVVAGAPNGQVVVASRALGNARQGTVMAKIAPRPDDTGRDFALVRVPGAGGLPMALATHQTKLMPVVAAGYPGAVIGNDNELRRLIEQGDMAAAPDLVLNRGEISAIQEISDGVAALNHTAKIMTGNSGGPLVDHCGRVVGINTFLSGGADDVSGTAGFALAGQEIARFLADRQVAVTVSDQACGDT